MEHVTLEVDEGDQAGSVRLDWNVVSDNDSWQCSYEISRPLMNQASELIRSDLHELVTIPRRNSDAAYSRVLQALDYHGRALRYQILAAKRIVVGEQGDIDEVDKLLESHSPKTGNPTQLFLTVILKAETIHVPWGFATLSKRPAAAEVLERSKRDFKGSWSEGIRLVTKYQIGKWKFPSDRCLEHHQLFALHEDLFVDARHSLRDNGIPIDGILQSIVEDNGFTSSTWPEIAEYWSGIANRYDSVVYIFGHSDGRKIELAGPLPPAEPSTVLNASEFGVTFYKEPGTRSASICILNGCRTNAPPNAFDPSFLNATHARGFYGFIGTETEVPNDLACLFGAQLLLRLHSLGESLGDAFDALRHDERLFPVNLVYSCFACRDFRFQQGGGAS